MDIDKWIEDHAGVLKANFSYSPDEVVLVRDLRELLKTHKLAPNEPTEAMCEKGLEELVNEYPSLEPYLSDCGSIYKAMIGANDE